MSRNYGELDYKKVYLEIHANYKNKLQNRYLNKIMNRKNLVLYLDWWVNWIDSSPVKIKYTNDNDLLFSHPLAFCNLIIDDNKYRIGFDLWDKYPIYTSNRDCEDASLIDRWNKCDVYFKTTYFDAKSSYRYRAPLGYIPKEEDTGREKAEEAFWEKNIFPGGIPLYHGKYFVKGRYKSFRSERRIYDVFSTKKKKNVPIRDEMISKLSGKWDYKDPFIDSYGDYLKRIGATKISIDFPSNSRITFRSAEIIAMGSLLVGPPICNIYPENLKLQEYMIICKPDLSDFIDKIDYYLTHDKERQRITEQAMLMWDKVMAPESLSEYWVRTAINYLKENK